MAPKLLLADDSVTIQRVIELTFADEDVHGRGRRRRRSRRSTRVQADRPDIVLADVGMPERDGYEVAAFIKGDPELAHIPVLLLTGAFEPVDEVRARAVGLRRRAGQAVRAADGDQPRPRAAGRQARAARSAAQAGHRRAPRDATGCDRSREPAADSLEDYFDRLDAALASKASHRQPHARSGARGRRRPSPCGPRPTLRRRVGRRRRRSLARATARGDGSGRLDPPAAVSAGGRPQRRSPSRPGHLRRAASAVSAAVRAQRRCVPSSVGCRPSPRCSPPSRGIAPAPAHRGPMLDARLADGPSRHRRGRPPRHRPDGRRHACGRPCSMSPSGSSARRSPGSRASDSCRVARARGSLPASDVVRATRRAESITCRSRCRWSLMSDGLTVPSHRRSRQARARRSRAEVDRALGRRRRLPVRSHALARRGLFDRHAAADRQRLAARRPRLLVHPHRRRRPLPADARQGRVLSDGMGRQRPADRAPRAELLRRPLRSVAAVRLRRSRRPTSRASSRSRSRGRTSSSCARG